MANVQVDFGASADESNVVRYKIQSTADINATPVVWADYGTVLSDGSASYSRTVNHPEGVYTFRVFAENAIGDASSSITASIQVQQTTAPISPPTGPLTLTNVV